MKNPIGPFNAMAFYNPRGFVPAFKQARAFAGEGNGARVATLPDIVEARLATKPGDLPWGTYFTTMSAEYAGLSRKGHPIAIVAHGVGPMSTLDGVLAAYSFQFNDKDRNNRGGRISNEEFRKLESGHYGEVSIVDLAETWNRRPYQFSGHAVTANEIDDEPLWQARLGKQWLEYAVCHTRFAQEWHAKQAGIDPENRYNLPNHAEFCDRRRAMHLRLALPDSRPSILAMDSASNCSYSSRKLFDCWMKRAPNTAIAHLLSIGGLMHGHQEYWQQDYNRREQRESLASDVDCHEWSNGTRLLGIQNNGTIVIHGGLPEYNKLVQTKLDRLWKSNPGGTQNASNGFWHLLEIGKQHFTDVPKMGDGMDSGEPEFLVTNLETIPNGENTFRTKIGGYHGFFKYGIDEVRRVAPNGANAYTVGDVEIEWNGDSPTHHVADVTFYKVEVDTSKRLVRMDDIYRNFDLMMALTAD